MNSVDTRRARVQDLYDLRRKLSAEIAKIEAEVAAEIQAIRRAKEAARATERRIIFRRRPEAVCGTNGGYYRHRRKLNEDACEACKLAHRVYESERVSRKATA